MGKIKIVTDSASDLDQEVLDKYNITSLPLWTIIDGAEYRDRIDLTPEDFYLKLQETTAMPSTSQVTASEFGELFKAELERDPGQDILYLAFASQLSGTYGSACTAKTMLQEDPRITVLDTRGASLGFGLIVIEAAQMAEAGKSLAEITARVQRMAETMHYVFIVGNMEMLKRGGRINAATAIVGEMLNIKPILNIVGGYILPLSKAHGMKKGFHKILEVMAEDSPHPGQTMGISYSHDREAAEQMQQLIEERFGQRPVLSEIGAVIGSHVGAGTIAVFYTADRQ